MRAHLLLLLTLLCVVAAPACQPQQRSTATNAAELREPIDVVGNDRIVSGCCSLDADGWRVVQQLSDSTALTFTIEDAIVELGFGPFEARERPTNSDQGWIDGVRVYSKGISGSAGDVREIVADVPVSAVGKKAGLRPYGLRMQGQCTSSEACRSVDALFKSLRF